MSDFGTRLRRLRKLRGLTQEALAINSGQYANAISNYEAGTREPTIRVLLRLAEGLRMAPSNLLPKSLFNYESCPDCGGSGVVRVPISTKPNKAVRA